MKSINFLVLLALSIATRVAHGQFVTVNASALASYGSITVSRKNHKNGAYEMIHSVNPGTNDIIDEITDVKTTLTKKNPKVGTRVSILFCRNGTLLKYPHPGKGAGKSEKWVCNIKKGNKWKKTDCTKFNILWDGHVATRRIWDLPEANDFITLVPLSKNFKKYVLTKKDVLIEGILEEDEALWTLAEADWRKFAYAYQFEKGGLSFFLVAQVSGQDEISYKVLVNGKYSWIPLTSYLSKYFVNIADKLRAARNPVQVPEIVVHQLPNSVEQELLPYINAENEKQGVLHDLKLKREEAEANPKGITIDLKRPNESKLYKFKVSTFDREKEVVAHANSDVTFVQASFGGEEVYTNYEFPAFLLVYVTNGEVSIINAISYNEGETYLTQYKRDNGEWANVISPERDYFLYPIDLDSTTWVDKRFLSVRKEIRFGEFCDVYTANEYIGVAAIYEKNKRIWKFETPQRGVIYVSKSGKEREYRFVIDYKGEERSVHVAQVGGRCQFKFDGEDDWKPVEKYVERFA